MRSNLDGFHTCTIFATGVRVINIQWDLFSLEDYRSICSSVDVNMIITIVSRLIINPYCWSAGLPDLLLIKAGMGIKIYFYIAR